MDRTKTTADVYGAFYDFSRMLKSKVCCIRNQEAGLVGPLILICEIGSAKSKVTSSQNSHFPEVYLFGSFNLNLILNVRKLSSELFFLHIMLDFKLILCNYVTKSPS